MVYTTSKKSKMVGKMVKSGRCLPSFKRQLNIPDELVTTELQNLLQISPDTQESTSYGIYPTEAKDLLLKLNDSFAARRLKQVFVSELSSRFKRAKSSTSKLELTSLIEWLDDVKVGSYNWSGDLPFNPGN